MVKEKVIIFKPEDRIAVLKKVLVQVRKNVKRYERAKKNATLRKPNEELDHHLFNV
jgi:hypothetical protein